MLKLTSTLLTIALVTALSGGCASTTPVTVDSLTFHAHTQWQLETPTHESRRLQFRIPSNQRGVDDATLIVWNFSRARDTGDGLTIQRTMDRWIGHFRQDDGTPSDEAAQQTEYLINDLPVHTIDLAGRYVHETAPGSGMKSDRPGYRLLGAYIVAPQGNYIVRLIGPESVVARHTGAFDTFIRSVRSHDAVWYPRTSPPVGMPQTTLTATRYAR